MPHPLKARFVAPMFRRIGFHARRIGGQLDRHFFADFRLQPGGDRVVVAESLGELRPLEL